MSALRLNHITTIDSNILGDSVLHFLSNLGGPSVIHITGRSSAKCRVIVTLLHGNEPSGLKAIYHLLSNQFIPEYDTKIIIASVVASLTEPVFTHRMLPGKTDLNRCFSSKQKDLQSQLAKAINENIKQFSPEAVVDIHNTSGSGPAFSVSIHNRPEYLAIASHFTHRMVYTDIRLGSIMEQDYGCPIVTIEAGGAYDEQADVNALNGITSYLQAKDIFEQKQDIEILKNPRRLELEVESTVKYDTKMSPLANVTFRQDIEKFNFQRVKENTLLAWVDGDEMSHFMLDKEDDDITRYFRVESNSLVTSQPLILFMITTREPIAKSDCLFYFSRIH